MSDGEPARVQDEPARVQDELARVQDELARSQHELQRSQDEFERFGSVASHDLAQPLQVAFGYLEMVRSEFGDSVDPLAAQWLGAASNSLEKMRRLVQEVVVFARTGKTELVKSTVDLRLATELAVGATATLIEERAATIEIRDLPSVGGNEHELSLVLQHLVANAVRYVPDGVSPHVRVSAEDAEGGVIVDVADNGAGIPEELRERVFDTFQRACKTEHSGNGLGLATCRRVVIRHGGHIWVEASELGGARFRFFVPTDLP